MACNSKTAGHRAKRGEICDSGIVVLHVHVWGVFDLLVFKVIWGNSVHLSQNAL